MSIKRRVITTVHEFYEVLKGFNTKEFSWDTETTNLRQDLLEITGASFCDGDLAFYVVIDSSLNVNKEPCVSANDFSRVINEYGLFSKDNLNIAHNWVFDARVVNKYDISLFDTKRFDTMVAHHLIDENSQHGLKYLVTEWLGLPVTKYGEVGDNHYSKAFYEYGIDDAINTYILYTELKKLLITEGVDKLFYNIEMPYQDVLLEMALTGVVIDKDLVSKTNDDLQRELNEVIFHMCRIADIKYEVKDDQYGTIYPYYEEMTTFKKKENELRRYEFKFSTKLLVKIFLKLNIPVNAKTKTGSPSIGKETMNSLMKINSEGQLTSDYEFIRYLYKYKIITKLLSGFITPLPSFIQPDGRVRPNFKDTGAVTGRLSASDPNVQQLAKPLCEYCGGKEFKNNNCIVCDTPMKYNLRSCFTVPKGYKMFSADYGGQEIAVMAQLSRDPTLVKSLKNGYDMHLAVANTFYNLDIPEDALSKDHPDYDKYKGKFKNQRSTAKSITFGLAYGKVAFGFAKDFGISEEEAQKLIDDYFRGMSKLKESIDNSHQELSANGYVKTLAGRKRRFEKNWKGEYDNKAYRQAFNFKIQSYSADMIRASSINVYRRKKKYPEWDLKQIMTVHDENVFQVKAEFLEEAAAMVKKAMEDVCKNFVVPVSSDIEKGDNYGTAK